MLQYILLVTLCFFTILFFYLKIKYPFWNNQPVFHTYDFWRYFYSKPFIVYKYRPVKTKFYDDNIKTLKYLETNSTTIENITDLIQCYYYPTDKIIHTISSKDLHSYFIGHEEPTFISFFVEPKYNVLDLSMNNPQGVPFEIITTPHLIGCLISNSSMMSYRPTLIESSYSHTPVYFMDFLCVSREHDYKKISRNLLQTHEFHQRFYNPNVLISLLKKEIELFSGVVPLVQYETPIFNLRNIKVNKLPKHFQIIQLNGENMDMLLDTLYLLKNSNLHNKNGLAFDIIICNSIGSLSSLIKSGILHIYCLYKGKDAFGFYFFKDDRIQFDDYENRSDANVLRLLGSICNNNSYELFYNGFLHSLRKILQKKEFYILMFENIGHNCFLYPFWKNKHTPIFSNKCAYYLYNFIFPCSPLSPEKCLFIL
jgi:hypothetical protein